MTGCYLLWKMRADQAGPRRSWIVWVGVPAANYLVALPDLLTGKMNDERTGTVGSLLLFALLAAAGVLLGVLAGFMVLLPIVTILRGLLLAATGRFEGLLYVVLAAFPLVIVAAGFAAAFAMDNVPGVSDSLAWTGGAAMLMRAFGVHNGVRIVDHTALVWFRVLAIINLLYVAVLCASMTRKPRNRRS